MSWFILLVGLLLVLPSHEATHYPGKDEETEDRLIHEILEQYHRQLQEKNKRLKEEENTAGTGGNIYSGKVVHKNTNDDSGYEVKAVGKGFEDNAFAVQNIDAAADDQENADHTQAKTEKPEGEGINGTFVSGQPQALPHSADKTKDKSKALSTGNVEFLFIVVACSVAGFVGLVMAGVCWYKLNHHVKAATDVEYPAYGVTGPTKDRVPSPGDRKLAQSAQMYHYQHQKQQMIAMEKASGEMKPDASEEESEEENEEGDYTVYECPGLAPTGEMEVRNPLFNEDVQTPVNGQTPVVNGHPEQGGKQ